MKLKRIILYTFLLILPFLAFAQENSKQDTLLARQWLKQAKDFHRQQKFDSLYHYCHKALPAFEAYQKKRELAEIYSLIAQCEYFQGMSTDALAHSKLAADYISSSTDSLQRLELNVKLTYAILLRVFGKIDSAILIMEPYVAPIFNHFDQFLDGVAGSFFSTLCMYYQETGEFSKAKYVHEIFLQKATEGEHIDDLTKLIAYSSIGEFYLDIGKVDNGLEYLLKAEKLLVPEKHAQIAMIVYDNLVSAYREKANYENALLLNQKAIDVYAQTFGRKGYDYAVNLKRRANLLILSGQAVQSLSLIEEVEKLYKVELPEDNIIFFDLSILKGKVFDALGDDLKALKYFREGLNGYKSLKTGIPADRWGLHLPYVYLLIERGNYNEAFATLDWLTELYSKNASFLPIMLSECEAIRANIFEQQKQWKKALLHRQRAIDYLFLNIKRDTLDGPINIQQTISRPYLFLRLNQQGLTYKDLYLENYDITYAKKALDAFNVCIELLDILVSEESISQQKQKLVEDNFVIFKWAVWLAYCIYYENQEIEWLKRSYAINAKAKAFQLNSALRESNALSFGDIPQKIIDQREEIIRNIGLTEFEYATVAKLEKSNKARKEALELRLAELRLQLAQWNKEVEKIYPNYYNLKYNLSGVEVDTLQAHLKPEELWIEFMVMDNYTYIYVVDQKEIEIYYLGMSSDSLSQKVQQFNHAVQNKNSSHFEERSHELFHYIFSGIDSIQHLNKWSKLIIIPDGPLSYLPFDLLISHDTIPENPSFRPYLLRSHSIIYNYSAQFWLENKSQTSPNSSKLLAFAPKIERERMLTLNVPETTRDALVPLPGSETEVINISKHFSGNTYIGISATEANFRHQIPKYDILHLATHGVLDPEQPLYSKLIFSQGTDSSDLDDGLLHTYEILNMQLNAQIASLSACNTGMGTFQEGEGVISLARGFAYAGCPNLVMSLWAVPDQATADIMTQFYEGLSNGMEKDEALRQAKLWYLDNSPPEKHSPYYWGAWVLVGDDKPLQKQASYWWYMIGGLLLLGFFIFSRYFFIKR